VREATPVTTSLAYSEALVERFPDATGVYVEVENFAQTASSGALIDEMRAAEADARALLETVPIAEVPSIAAWRRVFTGFGAKPTKYRNAAEALLRRIGKGDELPAINLAVDLGNLVSLRHRIPLGLFDLDAFAAPAIVDFVGGEERFEDLGSSETDRPDPGEVAFIDASGTLMTRRWCWRQARPFAASDSSSRLLVVIEGHHEAAAADVEAAITSFCELLDRHGSGDVGPRITLHTSPVPGNGAP